MDIVGHACAWNGRDGDARHRLRAARPHLRRGRRRSSPPHGRSRAYIPSCRAGAAQGAAQAAPRRGSARKMGRSSSAAQTPNNRVLFPCQGPSQIDRKARLTLLRVRPVRVNPREYFVRVAICQSDPLRAAGGAEPKSASLKLRVDSDCADWNGTAVAVVGWMVDDLAVQREVERFANAEVIISFEDLL
jgi:hypothetical protein